MRQAAVGERLPRKQLPERQPAAVEGVRGSGHVDPPYAEFLFTDFGARGIGVALQPFDPIPQRLRVMLAQRFGVDELQPRIAQSTDDPRDMRQFAAGKHVLLDEVADTATEIRGPKPVMRDAVVQHKPAWLE